MQHNFNEIKKNCSSNICCVIKADAYGHGAVMLAKEYEKLGATFFGVSSIDEALQLRRSGISLPILIFGYTPVGFALTLAKNNISQCVYSFDYAKMLSEECVKQNVSVNIHIKIDTGMSRIGFLFQNPLTDFVAIDEIREVCDFPNIKPQGIFTHFSSSDEGTDDFTLKQLENFNVILENLGDINFKYIHCANSGAIEDFKNSHFNMVRAGIILYGLSPSSDIRNKLDLKPVLSLKSVIAHVKKLKAGSSVSYGREFVAQTDMTVATVPIGYADGFSRILADNKVKMLVNGKACKVIGRICMDQLMIDLEDMENVKIGDLVTIIGEENGFKITVDDIAKLRKTINYEVVCDIGARVPRVYFKDGKEIASLNYIEL